MSCEAAVKMHVSNEVSFHPGGFPELEKKLRAGVVLVLPLRVNRSYLLQENSLRKSLFQNNITFLQRIG